MATPIPVFQAPNGQWVCRNGGTIAIGSTEEEAIENVLRHSTLFSFFVSPKDYEALKAYFSSPASDW